MNFLANQNVQEPILILILSQHTLGTILPLYLSLTEQHWWIECLNLYELMLDVIVLRTFPLLLSDVDSHWLT